MKKFEKLIQADSLERMLYWEQLRVNGMAGGTDRHGREREVVNLLSLWRDTMIEAGETPVLASWALSYLHADDIRALGFQPNGMPLEPVHA